MLAEFEDLEDEDPDPPWVSVYEVQEMHEIPYTPEENDLPSLLDEERSDDYHPPPADDAQPADPAGDPPPPPAG